MACPLADEVRLWDPPLANQITCHQFTQLYKRKFQHKKKEYTQKINQHINFLWELNNFSLKTKNTECFIFENK